MKKTLIDIVRATEMRGATALIETARGSPKLKDCYLVCALPGTDTKVQLTAILVGPDNTVSDEAFDYYLTDLDDPKTWFSSGVERPRRPVKKEA
ncbi:MULTISPECIES: hypothetical protein [Bradyrhizobium]|uniref:Uncharacterized protein n=1 Tax=Bradyrhizobium barranii subsp. barranii TaxID=2823807 RepID=A0A7Z0TQ86_9BRAD|nr:MULTISPECIES: hypothetical protein [Bradyrhizobium]MBR0999300.1 hypothetical protein [Bradyrhizobium liaoningense]MCP1747042.1 hypothetical protein [Bradyrhizobium japonicum]MCP1865700.1 hypothetical protein [Bradyrhizobium japonicum]MCP1895529.1 hypothetical protein [Bradyrhizobium japonicum]MCW2328912.1 hypothetical protein [Bradyrhizobium japonicum]